jgi:hypothetical protein
MPMSSYLQKPCVSVRRSRIENYDRETADKILDIYNASKKGQLDITDARKELVKIDPVLIGKNDWLIQQAYLGAKDIGGYPVAGRDLTQLRNRIEHVGSPESLELFKELVRIGSGLVDQNVGFRNVSDIAPMFLDVPGITFPPPYPFSNPRVRALFEHQKNEVSHNLDLRRDGLYFVDDEEPIVEILKNHITADISREEAEEQLREIHPGLLADYNPPTFT